MSRLILAILKFALNLIKKYFKLFKLDYYYSNKI